MSKVDFSPSIFFFRSANSSSELLPCPTEPIQSQTLYKQEAKQHAALTGGQHSVCVCVCVHAHARAHVYLSM